MDKPLVSIVIPTYNRPHLVGEAIQSAVAQTYENIEVIVVDDGLDKRADTVVTALNDPHVRYVAHEESRGCSGAKNTGIRESKGAYVAFLDDDDTFEPGKIASQVKALESASERVGFSFTGAREIYDDREYVKEVLHGEGDYHELALRRFSGMIASTLMFKAEVFENVGVLDESYPTHTDVEFLIRVTERYHGVGINEPLVRRLMTSGHVQMGTNIRNRIKGREKLLAQYKEKFEKHPHLLAKHLTFLAKLHRNLEHYGEARDIFWRAFTLQPRLIRLLYVLSMFGSGFGYRLLRRLR